jgi:flagellar basal-body rod protein FlgF
MQSSLYVALSAQVALQRRMETIANNVANSTVPGFRGEHVRFESMLSDSATESVAHAGSGDTYINRSPGQLVRTDNPLDIAVQGDAWFGIQTPSGTVYTRDGRMQISANGDLQSIGGHPMLDVGGAPIQVDPGGGPLHIASDGMITQRNRQLGAVGLFKIDEDALLERYENSGVIPDKPATPVLDFNNVEIAQGHIENSNVNPMWEMSELVMVSRSYEAVSSSISQSEDSLREAIRALGVSGS